MALASNWTGAAAAFTRTKCINRGGSSRRTIRVSATMEVVEEGRPLWVTLTAGAAAIAATVTMGTLASLGDRDTGYYTRYAKMFQRSGMDKFMDDGDIPGALAEFDEILDIWPPSIPYLWQRGICLYYVNKFEEGAKQFREDIKVHPNDSDEAIWCFLCEAQLYGVEKAREMMINIEQDSMPFMKKIYELFRYGGDPQQMLANLEGNDSQESFYATFYAGLYYEAHKNEEMAKSHITAACNSPYGSKAQVYMAFTARNHCKVRGWELENPLVAS